jgi:hypothetical protein
MEALNTANDSELSEQTDLEGVIKQFQRWRAGRQKIERIPEALWRAAASLYPRYSVFRIARSLRLDFVDIRDRIHPNRKPSRGLKRKGAVAAGTHSDRLHFMELPAASPAGLSECSVKLKDGHRGTRITIRLKASGVGPLLEMLRGLWKRAE